MTCVTEGLPEFATANEKRPFWIRYVRSLHLLPHPRFESLEQSIELIKIG